MPRSIWCVAARPGGCLSAWGEAGGANGSGEAKLGIPSQLARIILREHRHRPIGGKILSIARQTVYLGPDQAAHLVEQELAMPPRCKPGEIELDRRTRGAQGRHLITDRACYSLFTDADYSCLDISDYEGANIVADLCGALPSEYEGQFDFIIDGSCLDNIFDPAMALRNLSRLLRPGGRIIHLERASRSPNVYVAFSLSWFHDYYAVNDFDDCQVYLVQWDDLIDGRWDLYHYLPVTEDTQEISYFGEDRYYFPHRAAHSVVIAEKGAASSWEKSPIQFGYRPWLEPGEIDGRGQVVQRSAPVDGLDPYFRSALRFSRSARPPIVGEAETVDLPHHLFHYDSRIPYCGSIHPLSATGSR
jgi:SAM-dependent methyltransferase